MQFNIPQIFIQDFDYNISNDKIALHPKDKRDLSKLLVYRQGQFQHLIFNQLSSVLPENSFLIFNNTKVIPARIFLKKLTGTNIELFLLRPFNSNELTEQILYSQSEIQWECLVGNKKRWKDSEILIETIDIEGLEITLEFKWLDRENNIVQINWNHICSFAEILNVLGNIPLPPYIERENIEIDKERYQTVFSKELGAVAAPTASLHFSDELIQELTDRGVKSDYLTLHVGAGTFLPVKVDQVGEHPMHREQLVFSYSMIQSLLEHQGPFIPVGTTSLRALESLYWSGIYLIENNFLLNGFLTIQKQFAYQVREKRTNVEALRAVLSYLDENKLDKWIAETELLIMPGYQFHFCDALITNFHQPKSTLLVLISAIVGDAWKKIYRTAMETDYRFFSYGDSSILFNNAK